MFSLSKSKIQVRHKKHTPSPIYFAEVKRRHPVLGLFHNHRSQTSYLFKWCSLIDKNGYFGCTFILLIKLVLKPFRTAQSVHEIEFYRDIG